MANQSMEQKKKQDDQGGELLYCGPTDWDAVAKGDFIVYSQLKESCLRTPTRLSALTAITIRSVASGCAANHCVALDTQGRCYTWGLNGKGQLGHGDKNTRHSPTLVASLSDRTVVKAASGKRHTVLLTDTGESFAFGWNNYGQLGTGSHKNETVSSPERCFAPETTHTVACGSMFTVWVTATEGMSIMTAGMPQYGVLGHGTDGLYNTKTATIHLDFYPNPTPRAIKALAEKTITKVACGVNHTVTVDSEGFVYTWGCGNYGALGHGVQKDEWLPRVVEFFQRRMVLPSDAVVVAGNACSACTVTGGQMYMWGKWSRLSAADAWMKPRPLMTISGWNIRCIDFGTWGSMCGAEQSCISWGQSILGGLGFGSDGKGSSNHPDKVNALEGMHVLDVACGFGHSLIVVDRTNMHHRIQQLGVHGGGEADIDVKEEADKVGPDSSSARGKKRKAIYSASKATKVTNKEVTAVRKSKRVKVAESSKAAAKNGKMIEVEESSKASVKNGKKLKVAESSKAAMKNGKKVKVAESSKAAMKKKGKKKAAIKNGKMVPAVKGKSKAKTSTTSNKSNTQSIPKPRGRGFIMAEEDAGDFSWVWVAEGSTRYKIKCRFCPKIASGISRFKSHLSGIKGGGISECPNVPPEVKKKCALWRRQTDEENASKKRTKQSTLGTYTQGAGRNVQAIYGSSGGSHSIEGGSSHVQDGESHVVEEGAQPTLPGMGAWQKDLHDGARKVISQFFYACAIPYNVAAHPLFQLSFDAAIACGKGFKAPTPCQLAGPLLDQCVGDIKQIVESHKAHWERYGCSIMADGWTTSRGKTLINFLVSSYKGTLFLRSVDATAHVKRADYLASLFEEIIQEIGAEHIVQVITNNATNFFKAGRDFIMVDHPTIHWTPCAAHCLDLLLEDIGEISRFAEVIKGAKSIGKFVYNHTIVLNLMRRFTGKDLVRPAATRFATHFLTLRNLESMRVKLMQAFASDEWSSGDDFLKYRTMTEGSRVAELVFDSTFWSKVQEAVRVTEPLVHVLRIVDGEDLPMGKVYEGVDLAKEAIAKYYGDQKGKCDELYAIIDQRWKGNLHSYLHSAAHHMNPRIVYAKPIYVPDDEVKIDFMSTLLKMVTSLETQDAIVRQLVKFHQRQGMFAFPLAHKQAPNMGAVAWWGIWGSETPQLRDFAIRVLSQPVSASSCERNWSAFEHLYSKKCTRLTMPNLDKLVFSCYNLKLKFRTTDHMAKENMDLDALIDMIDDASRVEAIMEWVGDDDVAVPHDPGEQSEPLMSMASCARDRYSFTTADVTSTDLSMEDARAISDAYIEMKVDARRSTLRPRRGGDGARGVAGDFSDLSP